ncbi:MAG TPA: rhomboid family intramembrane serine protease, partial [Geothrix sp.]|nr:rhomboid family intramembrane serine protease [Geothrix sp.]
MTTFRAPWQDPNLYPPARLKDGRMGVWHDGQVEPMTLAGIVLGVSQDLGGEKPSGPGISLVEMPGEDRVVDVVDLPEVQRAMAHHLDDSLSRDIQQQGWIAWLLGPLILAGTLAGLNIGYFSIQVITSGQTWWESLQDRRSLRTSPGEYFAALSAKRRFDYWVSRSKWHAQWRTWSLGAVFLLVFLAEVVSGLEPAVDRAALVKSEVWAGQVWRLLTAALMHGSFMHLAMNGFAWISLGVLLERVVRPSLLFPLFLLSALGGNVASLIFLPLQPSLGASGGIMG